MDWIIKIGGSLFPHHSKKLLQSLNNINQKCMVIMGGGSFANQIREYDNEMKFSQETTHYSAILAMDILSILSADDLDFVKTTYSLEEAEKMVNNNKIPILLTSKILTESKPLEESWNITSDSIAAYFAHILNAKLLILTDVNGIYTRKANIINGLDTSQLNFPNHISEKKFKNMNLIKEITAKKLLSFEETSVDLMLPTLLIKYGLNCHVVNGKNLDRVLSIIYGEDNDNTIYTTIKGE